MSFEEALQKFIYAIELEFGVRDGVTQVSLSPELYDRVMYSFLDKAKYGIYFSAINDSHCGGVSIKVRTKESL